MNAIEIKELHKNFGANEAVKGLNLDIKQHELFGLLGVNGAGKTTTIRMICCLLKPTSGDIMVEGKSINNPDMEMEIKRMINLSPQETTIADGLTVKENLQLMAGLYGLEADKAEANVERIIKDFDLSEIAGDMAKTLSGGWQRRLSIAMALVTEPEILFMDEPTLGLDVIARRELWDTIRALKQKMTIVLTTHYLEEAEALCDRIAVMSKGSLMALGTAAELKAEAGTDNFEDAFIKLAGRKEREEDA